MWNGCSQRGHCGSTKVKQGMGNIQAIKGMANATTYRAVEGLAGGTGGSRKEGRVETKMHVTCRSWECKVGAHDECHAWAMV